MCVAKPLISGGVLGDSVVFSFSWANQKVDYLGARLIGENEINECGKEPCVWASVPLGCWWKLEIVIGSTSPLTKPWWRTGWRGFSRLWR